MNIYYYYLYFIFIRNYINKLYKLIISYFFKNCILSIFQVSLVLWDIIFYDISLNFSTVNLEKCEQKLRSQYHLENEEPFIMFKKEYHKDEFLMPVIEYEVYDIKEKKIINNYL